MFKSKVTPLILLCLTGAWMSGCSSKPKPGPDSEPSAPEMASQPPVPGAQAPDEDARRQRMLKRAGEVFQTVYFPYDQANLDERARQILADIRGFLLEFPEVSVSVEGHADERGTNEYNLALGDRRAGVVAAYLGNLGVPKSSLKTLSLGEEKPAHDGHTETDWKLNRRAEFIPAL